MFKLFINDLSTFKKQWVGGYLNVFFSEADKSIINHYHEKGYTAYKIWNENTERHLDKTLVKRL